jgi:hypothetical protein
MAGTINMSYEQDLLFGMLCIIVIISIFLLYPKYETLNIMLGLIIGINLSFILANNSGYGNNTFYSIKYACIPNSLGPAKSQQDTLQYAPSTSQTPPAPPPEIYRQMYETNKPQCHTQSKPMKQPAPQNTHNKTSGQPVLPDRSNKPQNTPNRLTVHDQISSAHKHDLESHEQAPWWGKNDH